MHKYAIIGLGNLGKKHFIHLMKLQEERTDIELVAICDVRGRQAIDAVESNIGLMDVSEYDFSGYNFYEDYKEMIEKEDLDFVLTALPTYLHAEVAVYAMNKGLHVFSEKPMALTLEGCEAMVKAARDNNRVLGIGQCVRFHPANRKIKEFVESGCFGKVRNAIFERYSATPDWAWENWILDTDKSGGCVLDLHVHDVDLANFLFGIPKSIRSTISHINMPFESVTAQYEYDGFVAETRGDWSLPISFPFTGRSRIDFEKATVTWTGGVLTFYQGMEKTEERFDGPDAFLEEHRAFLSMAFDGGHSDIADIDSMHNSIKMVMKEIEAAEKKNAVSCDDIK